MNFSRVAKKYVPTKDEIVNILKEEIRVRGENKLNSIDSFFNNQDNYELRMSILLNFNHISFDEYTDKLFDLYEDDEEVRGLIDSILK